MSTLFVTGEKSPRTGFFVFAGFVDKNCKLKPSFEIDPLIMRQIDQTFPCLANTDQPSYWVAVEDVPKYVQSSWNDSLPATKAQTQKVDVPPTFDPFAEVIERRRQSIFATSSEESTPPQPKAKPIRVKIPDWPFVELVKLAESITDAVTQKLVREAIGAYHNHHYRNAILLSWQAAIALLHKEVCDHHLGKLNELRAKEGNAKPILGRNGLTKIREREFLSLIAKIEVINEVLKDILIQCLELRNQASHPTGVRFGRIAVAYHLEMLILCVFDQF